MAKPIVSTFLSPDATLDNTFRFNYYGNQPYKNKIRITNIDGSLAYENLISSMKTEQILPRNTLVNGKSYYIQFSVFEVNNVESVLSDRYLFTCYKTPTMNFVGLTNIQNEVNTSNYNATINYDQEQGRNLKQYKFLLYDSNKSLLNQTPLIYYSAAAPISYLYTNLTNNVNYYIRCIGTTVDGIEVDSGYSNILPRYEYIKNVNIFEGNCKRDAGYVELNTNIVAVSGNSAFPYTITNGVVDLENNSVIFQDGLSFDGDFKLNTTFLSDTHGNKRLIEIKDIYDNLITVDQFEYETQFYFKMTVKGLIGNIIIYSDLYSLTPSNQIEIVLKRIGEFYDMKINIR